MANRQYRSMAISAGCFRRSSMQGEDRLCDTDVRRRAPLHYPCKQCALGLPYAGLPGDPQCGPRSLARCGLNDYGAPCRNVAPWSVRVCYSLDLLSLLAGYPAVLSSKNCTTAATAASGHLELGPCKL